MGLNEQPEKKKRQKPTNLRKEITTYIQSISGYWPNKAETNQSSEGDYDEMEVVFSRRTLSEAETNQSSEGDYDSL